MLNFWNTITANFGIMDCIDIIIVAFIFYKVLEFIQKNRAMQLLNGILIVIAMYIVSGWLNLHAVHWILQAVITLGAFAVVVIFQPELRKGLERMGGNSLWIFGKTVKPAAMETEIGEIERAVAEMSKSRTGGLIVLERGNSLRSIIETGTEIDAKISAELIGNIFYEGSPLHDGAVILSEGKLAAAGCMLPLTEDVSLPKSLGMRHRAGIGITESTDAISIIVSEETGSISLAKEGQLTRRIGAARLDKLLREILLEEEAEGTVRKWGMKKDVKDADAGKDAGDCKDSGAGNDAKGDKDADAGKDAADSDAGKDIEQEGGDE